MSEALDQGINSPQKIPGFIGIDTTDVLNFSFYIRTRKIAYSFTLSI